MAIGTEEHQPMEDGEPAPSRPDAPWGQAASPPVPTASFPPPPPPASWTVAPVPAPPPYAYGAAPYGSSAYGYSGYGYPPPPAPWATSGPATVVADEASSAPADERPWARRKQKAGAAAGGTALGAKLLASLKAAKPILLLAGSLIVYTELFGWWVAVGFMAMIYVHEMGHVVALRSKGIPASAPMFIPLFGALIRMRGSPANAYDEAVVGLAGPFAGTLAAVAALVAWRVSGSQLFEVIAYLGFLINLFNLIPMPPLDGGRAVAAIHPTVWAAGLAAIVGLFVVTHNVLILIVVALGAFELAGRLRARRHGLQPDYYRVSVRQRFGVGMAYFGLIAFLAFAMHATLVSTGGRVF